MWEYVDEDARLPGLRGTKGVAFAPQVYSLERTSPAALFGDVLGFFDGDVPSLVDVEAYRRIGPFVRWGGQGPCSPAYPGDPNYWREGSSIPLRRIHAYHDAVGVDKRVEFIWKCNMPGILPGGSVEFCDEMGRAGPGGCVDPGPDVHFMVECAVKRNVVV